MSKKIEDLQKAMHDLQAAYGKVTPAVELLVHFNLPHVGKIMPNPRQTKRDLNELKNEINDLADEAKKLKDAYHDLW